ncbi:MAG: hypothetical protein K0R26_2814 [Bacteroidota bacterium]|jgi:hypothetical protein|nr:hypothetical protein [Bacteroidota bacterium]
MQNKTFIKNSRTIHQSLKPCANQGFGKVIKIQRIETSKSIYEIN